MQFTNFAARKLNRNVRRFSDAGIYSSRIALDHLKIENNDNE